MKIIEKHSHLNGLEFLLIQKPLLWKEIQGIEDLQGKRVVVGKLGSGNRLTATNLLNILNVTPSEYIDWSPEDAVLAVLRGQVDAMFYVAGKPVAVFDNLNSVWPKTYCCKQELATLGSFN